MSEPGQPSNKPAAPELRQELATLIDRIGERRAREQLRVSRQALDRVLSGRPVQTKTLAACREGLAK